MEHGRVNETISGPSDAQTSTLSSPWSGRLRNNGKQKVDDYDASGIVSNTSMDNEIKLPRVQTPGVLKRIAKYVPPHEIHA